MFRVAVTVCTSQKSNRPMLQPIQLFQHDPGPSALKQKLELWTFNGASAVVKSVRCWDEGQSTLNACTTHYDPATMLVPLQSTLYISNLLCCFFYMLFICYFHSVCDVCCHQTTHCVCQKKYKNVRAVYYSAAQGDQTTWPLHGHVKDIKHAHFPICACVQCYQVSRIEY